ncbi:hypothetical protein SAMN03159341_101273, partial [Paenibacillus sp. 1_12]|uniref:WIAG-tail domain n=1 Tax=Paenibacillus sp. 1_12 TaxID=1566278 RepID=UPI0008E6063F
EADHLSAKAVGSEQLADCAVTSRHLALKSVFSEHIAEEAIGTVQLQDQAVTGIKLAWGAVEAVHLSTGSVGSEQLAEDAVASCHIEAGAIIGKHIADDSIGTAKLDHQSVTTDKLAPSAVGSEQLANGAVTSQHIAVGAVGSEQLGNDMIDGLHIKQESISGYHLLPGSITSIHLETGLVEKLLLAAASKFQVAGVQSSTVTRTEEGAAETSEAVDEVAETGVISFDELDTCITEAEAEAEAEAALTVMAEPLDDSIDQTTVGITVVSDKIIESTKAAAPTQQFGLCSFLMRVEEETVNIQVQFDEPFTDEQYALVVTTDQTNSYGVIQQKKCDSAIIQIVRSRYSPQLEGIVNWIAMGRTS